MIELAYEFLKHLEQDPSADVHCFQYFPEAPYAEQRSRWFHGTLKQRESELTELNRLGYGIAVCINETDGLGRSNDNIKRIRAIWLDDDGEARTDFPLEPSLVVNTSRERHHYYWFVQGDWSVDSQGKRDFQQVMSAIVERFGGDCQATDISRVMRLPGFDHLKGQPWLVTICGNSGKRYTRQELLKNFAAHLDTKSTAEVEYEDDAVWAGDVEYLSDLPDVSSPTTAPALVEANEEEPDFDQIEDALKYIPADDFGNWLKVGMALHHETNGGQAGYELWDQWSKQSKKYNKRRKQRSTWEGFRDNANPIKIATLFKLARENGWRPKVVLQPQDQLPQIELGVSRRKDDLAFRTMAELRKTFRERHHAPSEEQYVGLERVAEAIQKMADGDPLEERHICVSALPPGIGKTTTATHAIRKLVSMDEYKSVGVIFFLFRVEEIRNLVAEMGLPDQDFSVICSKYYLEEQLGNQDKSAARVLFTTQQMLAARLERHDHFRNIPDFWWNGRPRQVRIWDESIVPFEALTLSATEVGQLSDKARIERGQALASDLQRFADDLKQTDEGGTIRVPDLKAHNLSLKEIHAWYKKRRSKDHRSDDTGQPDLDYVNRKSWETLLELAGREVRVRSGYSKTALTYIRKLPSDIGPMLVMDASGQLRALYKFWHESRGNLFRLDSPQKSYSGLTVHYWDRASGAEARRDHGQEILEAVVDCINRIPPDESVLVVHPKEPRAAKEPDWQPAISEAVQRENVRFCSWGRHTATNEFKDCRHVVMLCINRYSPPQYEAFVRGAKNLLVEEEVTRRDIRALELGEVAHHIFQAACRGAVRNAVDGACPDGCHLYVICSALVPGADAEETWNAIFPGAAIREWTPVPSKLQGKNQKAALKLFSALQQAGISKELLRERLEIGQQSQLGKLLKDPNLRQALEAEGFSIESTRHHVIVTPAPEGGSDSEVVVRDEGAVLAGQRRTEQNPIRRFSNEKLFTSLSSFVLSNTHLRRGVHLFKRNKATEKIPSGE